MKGRSHKAGTSKGSNTKSSRIAMPAATTLSTDDAAESAWDGKRAGVYIINLPAEHHRRCWSYADLEYVASASELTPAAKRLLELERLAPVTVEMDRCVRCKVEDLCGLACGFCHNEGTPVNPPQRSRGRVSIYEATNGVNFLPGRMRPDKAFVDMLTMLRDRLETREVHWTGGEPTLNPDVAELTRLATQLGLTVKMTSNGERGSAPLASLHEAGLQGVNFSIFGISPAEFAAVQRGRGAGLGMCPGACGDW